MNPGSGKSDPTPLYLTFESPDPVCARISLGGLPSMGFYCTCRPGPDGFNDYARILQAALNQLKIRSTIDQALDHPPA